MLDIFFTVYGVADRAIKQICSNISPEHIKLGQFIRTPKYIKVQVRWWDGSDWNSHYVDFPQRILEGRAKDYNQWIEKQKHLWRHG